MAGLNTALLIWASLAAVVGAGCLWWRRSSAKEAALMASTPTSSAADVKRVAPGTLVEIKGTLRCAAPLTSEFSQQSCAFFKAEIIREEVWHENDSQGKRQRRTRNTTLHSNLKHAPCLIEDQSGTVVVDLQDATVEGIEALNELRQPGNTLVSVIATVASIAGTSVHERHKEVILPADIPVYLLGEVRADGSIGAPAKGSSNKTFLISNKTEEERASDIGSSMTLALWLAIASFAAAAGLLLWAWSKGPT
jgi:hypothetical protein